MSNIKALINDIKYLYDDGESVEDIATLLKCSETIIYRYLGDTLNDIRKEKDIRKPYSSTKPNTIRREWGSGRCNQTYLGNIHKPDKGLIEDILVKE